MASQGGLAPASSAAPPTAGVAVGSTPAQNAAVSPADTLQAPAAGDASNPITLEGSPTPQQQGVMSPAPTPSPSAHQVPPVQLPAVQLHLSHVLTLAP